MITNTEIKEIARKFAVPPSTIERDYAQNWLLKYLNSMKMAFKGGTSIRKVYIENYRFSDDLDFTLHSPVDKETIKIGIQDSIDQVRNASGIQFEEDVSINETKSGFRAIARFRIINRNALAPITIKLDINDSKNERILLPVVQKPLFHHFSDSLEATISSNSLEEIMAEKIRSLFQRTRSRDLYDIGQLSTAVNCEQVKSIIYTKFKYKDVSLDISRLNKNRSKFEGSWNASLRHQMKCVPDFNETFTTTIEVIKYYIDVF